MTTTTAPTFATVTGDTVTLVAADGAIVGTADRHGLFIAPGGRVYVLQEDGADWAVLGYSAAAEERRNGATCNVAGLQAVVVEITTTERLDDALALEAGAPAPHPPAAEAEPGCVYRIANRPDDVVFEVRRVVGPTVELLTNIGTLRLPANETLELVEGPATVAGLQKLVARTAEQRVDGPAGRRVAAR